MEPSENKGFNGRKLIQVSANSFVVVGLADDDATKQETVRGSEKRTFFGLPLPHIALIRQMDKGFLALILVIAAIVILQATGLQEPVLT